MASTLRSRRGARALWKAPHASRFLLRAECPAASSPRPTCATTTRALSHSQAHCWVRRVLGTTRPCVPDAQTCRAPTPAGRVTCSWWRRSAAPCCRAMCATLLAPALAAGRCCRAACRKTARAYCFMPRPAGRPHMQLAWIDRQPGGGHTARSADVVRVRRLPHDARASSYSPRARALRASSL